MPETSSSSRIQSLSATGMKKIKCKPRDYHPLFPRFLDASSHVMYDEVVSQNILVFLHFTTSLTHHPCLFVVYTLYLVSYSKYIAMHVFVSSFETF